jgi:hypothetical protein
MKRKTSKATEPPEPRPELKGRRVLLSGGGLHRMDTLLRVWWRGEKVSRVETSSGESVSIIGLCPPNGIIRGHYVLVVAPNPPLPRSAKKEAA